MLARSTPFAFPTRSTSSTFAITGHLQLLLAQMLLVARFGRSHGRLPFVILVALVGGIDSHVKSSL